MDALHWPETFYEGSPLRYVKANGERNRDTDPSHSWKLLVHIHAIDVIHTSEGLLYSLFSPTFLFLQCSSMPCVKAMRIGE